MSGALRACTFRVEHRHLWVVSARKGYHDPGHDMRWVNSNASTVYCPPCGRGWRTAALYVDQLPDADRSATELEPRMLRIAAVVDEYPLMAELTYLRNGGTVDGNRFLTDVSKSFLQYGSLSERQLFAAEGAIQRRMIQQAKTEASGASGMVPEGRHTVTGRITKAWYEDKLDEKHEPRLRMDLAVDEGYVVECTVPRSLANVYSVEVVGLRIRIELILKPAWGSDVKAWGSWPRNAEVLD